MTDSVFDIVYGTTVPNPALDNPVLEHIEIQLDMMLYGMLQFGFSQALQYIIVKIAVQPFDMHRV